MGRGTQSLFLARALWTIAAWAMAIPASGPARAGPWSVTLYGGPWTQRVVSQIVTDGNYDVSGAAIGLAVDRRLFRLGWGFSVEAEGQATENFDGYTFTTLGAGLGLRFDNFPWSLPTSFGAWTGPSYAINPPVEQYVTDRRQHPWLNYVSVELAVAVPWDPRHWDAVLRLYHRSGVWGLYSINADEGTTVGVGLRAKF